MGHGPELRPLSRLSASAVCVDLMDSGYGTLDSIDNESHPAGKKSTKSVKSTVYQKYTFRRFNFNILLSKSVLLLYFISILYSISILLLYRYFYIRII